MPVQSKLQTLSVWKSPKFDVWERVKTGNRMEYIQACKTFLGSKRLYCPDQVRGICDVFGPG